MTFQQVNTKQINMGAGSGRSFQATQLIWLFLGLLEAAFGLRFVLTLVGADPANLGVSLLYNFTGVFLVPFIGLTPAALSGLVLETITIIAMLGYALLGGVLAQVVWGIFYRPYLETAIGHTTILDQPRP